MCKEVRDFPIAGGSKTAAEGVRTIGTLIDNTPKDLISKVMLEEKVFKTWYHQRTVLLGDGKRMIGVYKKQYCYSPSSL